MYLHIRSRQKTHLHLYHRHHRRKSLHPEVGTLLLPLHIYLLLWKLLHVAKHERKRWWQAVRRRQLDTRAQGRGHR
ncbi:unnamed protein product [Rotaria sp. Silwood2]|nr:unnamed protein product [Rotaria sp. Silwood2]CAF4312991.1 unnamed protein product [Rotaria sp. Silwood2]